jgi:hypothetical protein
VTADEVRLGRRPAGGGQEPGDLGHHRRVAEDPPVPEAGGGDEPGRRPGPGDGRAVRPAGLGVLAVVDQQQGRGRDLGGHGRHGKGRHRQADAALHPVHQAGADPLAEAKAAGEGAGVGQRVGHRGDEDHPGRAQPAAQGERGRGRAQGVGDHGRGRALGGRDRGQGVGELEDRAAARPLGARVGDAVAGRVEGHHPAARRGQRDDEGVQLPAPAAPAVD